MGDLAIVQNDQFEIKSTYGDASLSGKLTDVMKAMNGLQRVRIQGKAVCVEGDELLSIIVMGVIYRATGFDDTPGTGLARVRSLGSDQLAKRVKVMGKPVILQGSQLDGMFQGMFPSMNTKGPSPIPDPKVAAPRMGKGTLTATESRVKIT
jgi:uncharacterized Zn-binding protein involved in type VI secretion